MNERPSLIVVLLLAIAPACAHAPLPDEFGRVGPVRSYRLLSAVLERPTPRSPQSRKDLEVDTSGLDRTPHIVAEGVTQPMTLDGARARLYGDEAGTQGFSVDNCIFIEVLTQSGKPFSSGAVGSCDTVSLNHVPVDNVGARAFTFTRGQVDLTPKVPANEPFVVRGTVLDMGGVGKVSDVYVVLEHLERPRVDQDWRRE